MAQETVKKNTVQVLLRAGTDDMGNVVTVNTGFGAALSQSGWDGDKALAIVNKLGVCLSKPVHTVHHITTAVVSGS